MSELISKNLKSLRERLGYTQKNVAEKIGVKPSTISGYESGARTPNPNTMVKLANVYEVSLDYLHGVKTAGKDDNEESEFMAFENDPEMKRWFKELQKSKEEDLRKLYKIWRIIENKEH